MRNYEGGRHANKLVMYSAMRDTTGTVLHVLYCAYKPQQNVYINVLENDANTMHT
jgi:hypothetical protein